MAQGLRQFGNCQTQHERWHAIRARIACRGWSKATLHYREDGVVAVVQQNHAVADQRRIGTRLALALQTGAVGAVLLVQLGTVADRHVGWISYGLQFHADPSNCPIPFNSASLRFRPCASKPAESAIVKIPRHPSNQAATPCPPPKAP